MIDLRTKLKALARQLYPSGRVFKMPDESVLSDLHDGLIEGENRLIIDSKNLLNSILPDNDDFSAEDAIRWESFLGLISNPDIALTDRKLAIIRKMNHPGTIPTRQSAGYLQDQLQASGFNVFVHENIPETQIQGISSGWEIVEFGPFQFGQVQFGQSVFQNKVVNHINQIKDINFISGTDYRSVFFIGGEIFNTVADVDFSRKNEFRQLILRIKPAQTVGYLLINYT